MSLPSTFNTFFYTNALSGQDFLIGYRGLTEFRTDVNSLTSSLTNVFLATSQLSSVTATLPPGIAPVSLVASVSSSLYSQLSAGANSTLLIQNSTFWDNSSTFTGVNSANYLALYTAVTANSAVWSAGNSPTLPSVITFVENNSSFFLNSSTFTDANSANYLALYTGVSGNSALWNNAFTFTVQNSSFLLTQSSQVAANSAAWNNASTFTNSNYGAIVNAINFVTEYSSFLVNESTLGSANSAFWINSATFTNANSANYLALYTAVSANSATWNTVITFLESNSAYILNEINLVAANSAFWNNSDTFSNTISAAYLSLYTAVSANSGLWGSASNPSLPGIITFVQTNSSFLLTQSSQVAANSAAWNNASSFTNTNYAYILNVINYVNQYSSFLLNESNLVASNSAFWNNASTFIDSNSGNDLAVYTAVSSTSSYWNTISTFVTQNSSFLLNASTFTDTNSANYLALYTGVSSNSAFWNNASTFTDANSSNYLALYTTVTANSSVWGTVTTFVQTNSAHQLSVYSTVNTNSGTWNGGGIASTFSVISALGTTQGTANLITTTTTIVSSCLSGTQDSLLLPVFSTQEKLTVSNQTSNSIYLFPQYGSFINTLSANQPYIIVPQGSSDFNLINSFYTYTSNEKNTLKAYYYVSKNLLNMPADGSTQINFDGRLIDTHNAVTTFTSGSAGFWKFTAPFPCTVNVDCYIQSQFNAVTLYLFKNNSEYISGWYSNNSQGPNVIGNFQITLAQNDWIDLRPNDSSTISIGGGVPVNGTTSTIRIYTV